jgi:phosphohistidine swiveling domain-containing protein
MHSDLERLGGKGANLVRLADAGLPVPAFAVIETSEYHAFVESAGLRAVIEEALRAEPATASVTIRQAFGAAPVPPDQHERLAAIVSDLTGVPVAVRSSATAEDLPGFSFAGQQDTFLNVEGVEEVLHRVIDCWSSLWTERAITYRARNNIDSNQVGIAVVVQQMVDATASGVLFTANPRTGLRAETVIDATPGLGEALVSGQVIPDTFTLDPVTGGVRQETLTGAEPTLDRDQLRVLGSLGQRIAELYAEPMDIEWARVNDTMHILQARPITSLYPLPEPHPRPHPEPEVWFSFGAFQGMLEPITPLGLEMIRMVAGAPARVVGGLADWRAMRSLQPAGERIWIRVDGLLRIRATRKLIQRALPLVEPGTAAILTVLATESSLQPTRPTPSPHVAVGLLRLFAPALPRFGMAQFNPAKVRRALDRTTEEFLAEFRQKTRAAGDQTTPPARLNALVDAMEDLAARILPTLLPAFAPIMATAIVQVAQLRKAAAATGLPDADQLAMNVLRSLPGNVTTEMDLVLADHAAGLHADPEAVRVVAGTPADELARHYFSGDLPTPVQAAVKGFLAAYGMRGVGEIDLGAPRWRDDPTPVLQNLKSYVQVTDPKLQPRAMHRAGEDEAERSVERLIAASPGLRGRLIKHSTRVIRGLFGARETPKFTIIRAFGLLRDGLDASAAELVAEGRLTDPADLYFLRVDELRRAFTEDWHETVATRRATWAAERRRGQVPRVLVEDGRTFYEGLGAEGDLQGMGVSPGVAEGPVRVVADPRESSLQLGDILVCKGTDPAWTPLFLSAAGLITEVGGLMTHGSVVAREYGIPAVVGVHEATRRLRDGQRVRIDGTSGAIELVED